MRDSRRLWPLTRAPKPKVDGLTSTEFGCSSELSCRSATNEIPSPLALAQNQQCRRRFLPPPSVLSGSPQDHPTTPPCSTREVWSFRTATRASSLRTPWTNLHPH